MEWLRKMRRRWHNDIAQWNEDLKNTLVVETERCKNELRDAMASKLGATQGTLCRYDIPSGMSHL